MRMTPIQFLDTFVDGNHDDCHANPGCVRRAFNASLAASHLADQYFAFNQRHKPAIVSRFPKIGDYVEHLSNQTNGAFRDIRSIANAYKHLYTDTDPKKATHSCVSSSGSIESIQLCENDSDVHTISEDYTGSPGKPEGRSFVAFTRKDGSKSEFLPILDTVVDYWRKNIDQGT